MGNLNVQDAEGKKSLGRTRHI